MENSDLVIPGLDQEDIGTLTNTRTFLQYCEMVSWVQKGICKFCELDTKINKVILENNHWRAWENPFPQKYTAHHFIIAHRDHLTHLRNLMSADGQDFFDIMSRLAEPGDIHGGGVVMRFGDPRYNAGSVRHLHANLFVPDGTGEVRVPLCKTPEDIQEKIKVIRVFEMMRQGIALESLSQEEQNLVCDRLR